MSSVERLDGARERGFTSKGESEVSNRDRASIEP
jgi:hypothetical protein